MHETRGPSRTTLTTALTYLSIGLWASAGAAAILTWSDATHSSVAALTATAAAVSVAALHRQVADLRSAHRALLKRVTDADMQSEVNGVRMLKILAALEAIQRPGATVIDLAPHADRRSRGA
ncbi:hypothetical protein GCM10027280_45090 [Micromonospora polyrhachis]|uniref:Uncharacterized protein n=1 Tax=Micromonospora polyrhachis TaxID=1282883 RepID=A0A7W7SRK3_9ACTN|nr:hypothetical protein [Micromonospora polyrhachis]